jgi:hypothetical protein
MYSLSASKAGRFKNHNHHRSDSASSPLCAYAEWNVSELPRWFFGRSLYSSLGKGGAGISRLRLCLRLPVSVAGTSALSPVPTVLPGRSGLGPVGAGLDAPTPSGRFFQPDLYRGALADLGLATDPLSLGRLRGRRSRCSPRGFPRRGCSGSKALRLGL